MQTKGFPGALLPFALALTCCVPATPTATTADSGQPGDGGASDAGQPFEDAGGIDAGGTDAGGSDGGSPDAGWSDAGGSDAGLLDGGESDAGAPDAGSPADAGPADAGADVVACAPGSAHTFPSFNRACSSVGDCTIGLHQTDCCGSMTAMGIAASAAAVFATDEASCEAMYPACDCASNLLTTDDGAMVPAGDGAGAVIVQCTGGLCSTSVRPSVTCDQSTCTPTQVCVRECSGVAPPPDAGPLPSVCVDVPAACATSTSCSCFGGTDPCPTGACHDVRNGAPTCLCE